MNDVRTALFLLSMLCLLSSISHGATQEQPRMPATLENAADALAAALTDWNVHHVDHQPSVIVDDQQGYRVVLRRHWKELPPGVAPQQVARPLVSDDERAVTRHTDWHFVLFPFTEVRLAPETKRSILWHVPDEKQFRLPVYLGEGHGFHWFSYISIPLQHFIREQLALTGGDDRLRLAVRGLSVEDEGSNTRNSVLPLFAQYGNEGFETLDEVIRTSHDPTNAIRSLAYFRDERATRRLVELYESADEQAHRAAAYALVHPPYRAGAKEAYLDMVRRQLHVTEAMQACLNFQWAEALPLLEEVIAHPSSLGAYREAYRIYRELSGNPIDADLLAAAEVIKRQSSWEESALPTPDELARARETIVRSADGEGAAFIGITLATFVTKGNTAAVKRDGLAILRALPQHAIEPILKGLVEALKDSHQAEIINALRQMDSR